MNVPNSNLYFMFFFLKVPPFPQFCPTHDCRTCPSCPSLTISYLYIYNIYIYTYISSSYLLVCSIPVIKIVEPSSCNSMSVLNISRVRTLSSCASWLWKKNVFLAKSRLVPDFLELLPYLISEIYSPIASLQKSYLAWNKKKIRFGRVPTQYRED